MLFNPLKKEEIIKAQSYLEKLIKKGAPFELTSKQKKSVSQNSYFHVIIALYAIEAGETKKHTKDIIIKQIICPDIFKALYQNPKNMNVRIRWRSTAELTTVELSKVVNMVRTRASIDLGAYLPSAEEFKSSSIEYYQEIERNNEFL
jgi:hypothetical protein